MFIDGSYGESGGQILRTAIALATILKKPIRITNIRKGRCNKGLRPQHLTGVKIAGEFCNAEIRGLHIGSEEIEYFPSDLKYTDKKIDIGTAGSISLLLQGLLPILIFTDKKITIEIRGGTDGKWAPPILYFKHVTLPVLRRMGVDAELEVLRYGFYPKGDGLVKIVFKPTENLKSINLTERGKLKKIGGISLVGSLPEDIAERQAESARKILKGYDVEIEKVVVKTLSPGTSMNLFAEFENIVLGSNSLGERGKKAEMVGKEAAEEMIKSIRSYACLDKHMSDQIIPFMGLAKNSKVRVEEISQHCKTNIFVTEQLFNVKFRIDERNKIIEI